jgi:hypothetical protein
MMTAWSMGDTALSYLEAFVKGGTRPGDLISPSLFKGPVHISVLMADGAIPDAMDYAAGQGWVEKLGPDQYRLTNAGFVAAQSAN